MVSLTPQDLRDVEKFADEFGKKFKVDVNFTKHFADRANDERNKTPISAEELIDFFRKAFKKYGGKMRMMGDKGIATLTQISSKLNLPFVMKWDSRNNEWDFVAKTIMRTGDFKTSDTRMKFESRENVPNIKRDIGNWTYTDN